MDTAGEDTAGDGSNSVNGYGAFSIDAGDTDNDHSVTSSFATGGAGTLVRTGVMDVAIKDGIDIVLSVIDRVIHISIFYCMVM
jgi:hypothetical protein